MSSLQPRLQPTLHAHAASVHGSISLRQLTSIIRLHGFPVDDVQNIKQQGARNQDCKLLLEHLKYMLVKALGNSIRNPGI
jgi:hypothetical protein